MCIKYMNIKCVSIWIPGTNISSSISVITDLVLKNFAANIMVMLLHCFH